MVEARWVAWVSQAVAVPGWPVAQLELRVRPEHWVPVEPQGPRVVSVLQEASAWQGLLVH